MIDKLTLVSLGSGSTIPDQRPLAATYLNAAGDEYLIDAPEGVQRELLRREVGLSVDTIFITSQAKRSSLGLPGLLNTLSHIGDRTDPLTIYCPPGGLGRVRSIVDWFGGMNYVVNVKEILPGEFDHVADDYRVDALNTSVRNSYGLKFTEMNLRGVFDREKAEALGISPGPKFGKLCSGEAVESNSGSIVEPEDVLGATPDPLTVVISGRTPIDDTVLHAAQRANVLIHDAVTFEEHLTDSSRSTLNDAVDVANESQPEVLALYQIGHSVGHKSDDDLVKAARKLQQGTNETIVFSVGTEIAVTHNGTTITHRSPR